jgi:hypothetical protein
LASDNTQCVACDQRHLKCVKQAFNRANRGFPSTQDIRRRIAQLQDFEERLDRARKDKVSKGVHGFLWEYPQTTISTFHDSDNNLLQLSEFGETSPYSMLLSGLLGAIDQQSTSLSIVRPTMTAFSHVHACRALLVALESTPNAQRALETHGNLFSLGRRQVKSSSDIHDEYNSSLLASLTGDNPLKIARAVQVVAMQLPDLTRAGTLVTLVERVIVFEDEIFGTLEGLECAFMQCIVFITLGEFGRAW